MVLWVTMIMSLLVFCHSVTFSCYALIFGVKIFGGIFYYNCVINKILGSQSHILINCKTFDNCKCAAEYIIIVARIRNNLRLDFC